MALINCSECKHPMSDDAQICPNCHKPRAIGTLGSKKSCVECGRELDFRKRKCQYCGTWQTKVEENQNKMGTTQKERKQFNKGLLIGFICTVLIMYFTTDFWKTSNNTPLIFNKNIAKLDSKVNGLYVFIESIPACDDCYEHLGSFKGENIVDVAQNVGIGKEKAGRVLANIFLKSREHLSFSENILNLTETVKIQYPNSDAIIIHHNMNECEVIKYK